MAIDIDIQGKFSFCYRGIKMSPWGFSVNTKLTPLGLNSIFTEKLQGNIVVYWSIHLFYFISSQSPLVGPILWCLCGSYYSKLLAWLAAHALLPQVGKYMRACDQYSPTTWARIHKNPARVHCNVLKMRYVDALVTCIGARCSDNESNT